MLFLNGVDEVVFIFINFYCFIGCGFVVGCGVVMFKFGIVLLCFVMVLVFGNMGLVNVYGFDELVKVLFLILFECGGGWDMVVRGVG